MISAPRRLHIPPLLAGVGFTASWNAAEGAVGYELSASFGESFEAASIGQRWEYLDDRSRSWNEAEELNFSWAEFEQQPSRGSRRWFEIDGGDYTWNNLDDMQLSWADINNLPENFIVYRGEGREVPGPDAGLLPINGRSWQSHESRLGSWFDFESQSLSWENFENLNPDTANYTACDVFVPFDASSAYFKLRAYDASGNNSDYLISGRRGVTLKNTTEIKAGKGERILLSFEGEAIRTLNDIVFNINYDHTRLLLLSFGASAESSSISRLIAATPGYLRFYCEKAVSESQLWSGLLSDVEFEVLSDSPVLVSLEIISNTDNKIYLN